MCKALQYEYFVRDAFNANYKGGDPAHLASADTYNLSYLPEYFNKVKTGTSYAIAIYNFKYKEEKELKYPEDYHKLDEFLKKVLDAKNTKDIDDVIESYKKFTAHF